MASPPWVGRAFSGRLAERAMAEEGRVFAGSGPRMALSLGPASVPIRRLGRQRFRSQTIRRPCNVSSGSTVVIVRECGAISSARPPVATTGAFGSSELLADPVDDRVDLAGEAVDEARLQRRDGRLRDHAFGRDERHLRQPRRAREERVHRDLHPRRQHAAGELARGRDDVEVRRGAEVDDDGRRAVPLPRADGVGDPIRADLARDRRSESASRSRRPGPSTSRSTPAHRSANASYSRTSGGTDEHMTSPSIASSSTRERSRTASSSAVWAGFVPTRNCFARTAPSNSPRTVCVLPTSIASSIRRAPRGPG